MTATADHVLADTRHQVNITLWMVTVRRALANAADPAQKLFLARMLAELNNRLPERTT